MKKPFLVGIAGGSASGKSTLCKNLEIALGELKIKSIHMDSYFRPEKDRPFTEAFVTGIKYLDDNHPLTMNLEQLKTDVKALYNEEYDLIIIEGLLTLWDDEICKMLDLKLFIDCEPDERLARRIKRNMQKGLTMDEITSVYLDMVRYRHNEYVAPSKWRSDLIINGSWTSELSLKIISEYIKNNYNDI